MSLMKEYIDKMNKGWGGIDLENELLRLIKEYNKLRDTYLFVYTSAIGKPIPAVQLMQDDFYTIYDLLSNRKDIKKIDFYIETPGGSGETAEDIVRFLHGNFESVSFVISGEAKSAGTIIVLSGDDILMTKTGSLGPIDAQMKIGRSIISAYDYMEWVDDKREEAEKNSKLNPFDATMVAQITPGELGSVYHALKFAEDLVVEWLINYKFKKWNETETRKIPVTNDMKVSRANEIARELTNHSKWRSHGRSIKIDDLEKIGVKITKVDDDQKLSDIVYRIQTVCRLLFESTTVFKIFATQENKIFKQAVQTGKPIKIPQNAVQPDVVEIDQKCPKCGKSHKLYGKFVPNKKIDVDFGNKGFIPIPKDLRVKCSCGFEIDISGIKNQIEIQTGRKLI
mgnify:CR=1 FL=1